MRNFILLAGLISGIATAVESAAGSEAFTFSYVDLPGAGNTGAIQVTIKPNAAVQAGSKWRLRPDPSFRKSGSTLASLSPGKYSLKIRPAGAFVAPKPVEMTIKKGKLLKVTAKCLVLLPAK